MHTQPIYLARYVQLAIGLCIHNSLTCLIKIIVFISIATSTNINLMNNMITKMGIVIVIINIRIKACACTCINVWFQQLQRQLYCQISYLAIYISLQLLKAYINTHLCNHIQLQIIYLQLQLEISVLQTCLLMSMWLKHIHLSFFCVNWSSIYADFRWVFKCI